MFSVITHKIFVACKGLGADLWLLGIILEKKIRILLLYLKQDETKDQSYFYFKLRKRLKKISFRHMLKDDTRLLAKGLIASENGIFVLFLTETVFYLNIRF